MTVSIALVQMSELPSLPPGIAILGTIGRAWLVGKAGTCVALSDPLASTRGSGGQVQSGGAPSGEVFSAEAVLVGHAFYRDSYRACPGLAADELRQLVASEGAWAIRELWGTYILAWCNGDGQLFILRSPLTGPALFHTVRERCGKTGETAHCAFTDPTLARALGFALARPDPEAVDAYLRYPLLRTPRSTITGVAEILPGEIARLDRSGRCAASWSPWDHATSPPKRADPRELGDIVRACVGAWSERFPRIQLELSGGIDSSIVAACLADRSKPWRAVTMVTPEPDGDERIYARAVAVRANVRLAELMLPDEPADPVAPATTLRVRPGGFGLIGPTDAAFLASARDYRADAIFSGTAGDGAFGYQTSIAPALDALHFVGFRAALKAARDQARITDDNIWNAIRHGLRGYFRGIRLWPVDDLFLSPRYAGERPCHPWLADAGRIPPGQRRYGLGLLSIQPFLDGYDRSLALPKIAPLLSQPLIEFGLGVPSWQWGEGGINRALAREAFRSGLPEIVLRRRSKGRILSMFLPAFERNRTRLADYLLGGWLAEAGLLEGGAIAEVLTGRGDADTMAMLRILQLADIEGWARSVVASGTPL